MIVSVPGIAIGYQDVLRLGSPGQSVPMLVHARGVEIARAANHGRVLTLAPIFPLEGGADIYPELATGPFAHASARSSMNHWKPA